MIYLILFLTFFEIGVFTFGGGYGMIPLMQQATVESGWITEAEFLNFVAIAESTPGPFAVNMATFIGAKQGGITGALCATLGVITPSIVIILLIAAVFKKLLGYRVVKGALSGIKPVVVGLIFSTGVWIAVKNFLPRIAEFSLEGFSLKALLLSLGLGVFALLWRLFRKKSFSPVLLIIASAALGTLIF